MTGELVTFGPAAVVLAVTAIHVVRERRRPSPPLPDTTWIDYLDDLARADLTQRRIDEVLFNRL
jgi:hypothetical protein